MTRILGAFALSLALAPAVARADGPLKVGVFAVDASPPVGSPLAYDPTKAATISPTTGFITSAPSPYNGLILPGTGFSDKAKQVVAPSVYNNPQVQALFHNLPSGLINTVYNTFAPRAGFAFDLTGQQTTVLHGGYGMSYERVEGNYIYGASSQLPLR